ncbi:hypothetical protein HUT18_03595 [Streptomyces sp. NA04227]|uniref:hypothetical protein n=1 Tax=Streptomyces sp. NA04227 TaxID=2742136 RepID=UPI001591EFDD|nr:hypothetical protein [Streptomyces sp. NA04227]QKW05593.1 hypothetical protein HUT18_03595 [Streptomyces sp. NA04227]
MTPEHERPLGQDELAELRRSLDVGLAQVEGRLALLAQRAEQAAKEQDELAARVTVVEHSRWPLPAVTALTAAGALVLAVWQAFGR